MKKHFLTGLAVLMPVALTCMIIVILFDFFTAPFVNLVGQLFQKIQFSLSWSLSESSTLLLSRILSLILISCGIFFLGLIARWFLFKPIIAAIQKLLGRIPLIKTVYKILHEIISALFSVDGKKVFKKPILFPFPDKPLYCMGFQTGEVAKECQDKIPYPLETVFLPTAPHPISGFLLLMPKSDVVSFDMNNEDAIKYLLSCGLVYPTKEKAP